MYTLLLTLLLLFSFVPHADATIPAAASNDPRFHLGYLVCDTYQTNMSNGSTNATVKLNECIKDAYDNQLAAYLEDCDGVYMVNDTLRAYEWLGWNTSQNRAGPPPVQNNVIRGSHACQPTRPKIKLMASAPLFDSLSTPRPVVNYRGWFPLNSSAVVGTQPSDPLGNPINYRDASGFIEEFEGIDIDTSEHVGAIGIVMVCGQGCLLANSKITATSSLAGLYNPPGRNSPVVNFEVVGGKYCIIHGAYAGLNLPLVSTQGANIHGLTCTNQTTTAILSNDGVPGTITGFSITKSSDGPAIDMDGGMGFKDGKIVMSGSAADDPAILNTVGEGRNLFLSNVFLSGTNKLIQNPTATRTIANMGTWARVVEYAYNDQFQYPNNTGSTAAATFPSYPTTSPFSSHMEQRDVINGVLNAAAEPLNQITSSVAAPPTDLITRHIWTDTGSGAMFPTFDDGQSYIDPTTLGDCDATIGYSYFSAITGPDCTDEINQAIATAEQQGHNKVLIPRGSMAVSSPNASGTPAISLRAHTKLIGAGQQKSAIVYKSTWAPTAAVPFIQTTNVAADDPYMGFFSLYLRTDLYANDFMYFIRWRAGKNSMSVAMEYASGFKCKCSATCPASNLNNTSRPRNALWFSGNGGGKHYVNQFALISDFDRNAASRTFFFDNTSQPLSIYGFNVEGGKGFGCGSPTAGTEATGASNIRLLGAKHEGPSAVLLSTNSSNILLMGVGAMSAPPSASNLGTIIRVTGSSNNILVAPLFVRGMDTAAANPATYMIKEALTSPTFNLTTVPWPNGIVYKRGTLDDTPFTDSTLPPPAAPTIDSISVTQADKVDVQWFIFDSTAMLPAPPTNSTGWTVTVAGVTKTVQTALRTSLNTYQLTFTPGTITTGTQSVVVSYSAVTGNITAGGTGTPAASGFSGVSATNTLSPGTAPAYAQVSYGVRSIYGTEDVATSPWYENAAGQFENVPFRPTAGGAFRTKIKVQVTGATAPAQSFQVYYDVNGSGTFVPLTNSLTDPIHFTDAPDLADGAPIETQQLTPAQATFVPCGIVESETGQATTAIPVNGEAECEVSLCVNSTAPINNVYRLELRRAGGAAFDSYTQRPTFTVVNPRSSLTKGMNQ